MQCNTVLIGTFYKIHVYLDLAGQDILNLYKAVQGGHHTETSVENILLSPVADQVEMEFEIEKKGVILKE